MPIATQISQDPIRPGNFSRYPDFPFLMPNRHISGLI